MNFVHECPRLQSNPEYQPEKTPGHDARDEQGEKRGEKRNEKTESPSLLMIRLPWRRRGIGALVFAIFAVFAVVDRFFQLIPFQIARAFVDFASPCRCPWLVFAAQTT
ncbi:MAG: hypothetical protein LBI87_02085 [Candidatus Accumulibacter sp.]|nr:hypothetical protein [Accumulibacter sp.]